MEERRQVKRLMDIRLSVARVECGKQRGAGVLVSYEGHFITCAHLVDNPRNVKIFLVDNNKRFSLEFSAVEVFYCRKEDGDFCLLKIQGALPNHLQPLDLFSLSKSNGNEFVSFGFPTSKPKEGVEGKGIIQKTDLGSEAPFPVIQLEDSNSISHGFSGGPIFDTEIGGIIGIINEGVVDTESLRQLGTSFGIPIEFIGEKCKEALELKILDPQYAFELPRGFTHLKSPKSEKILSTKIKYQDFLESNNLAYAARDKFNIDNVNSEYFITESFIINKLLNNEDSEGGIIYGEGGVGKTRLMLEIGQLAIVEGWCVIRVHPDVASIEDLSPFLNCNYKYLFLFDYIEESKCFNSDIVSKLNSGNEQFIIKILANCRYTYRSSSNFPDTFLQIELSDSKREKDYQAYVTQSITQEVLQYFKAKNASFFNIKPSFAVFLKFLLYKEKLETIDIREVGDFKTWIKKRFRLTFSLDDFAKLDKKVIYFLSILPLENEAIDQLYKAGFTEEIQKLKNDGWIDEVQVKGSSVLKAIHDTIVDELLIIHLEYVKKDIKREINSLLDFAIQHELQINWLRSMERIAEQPIFVDKNYFYQVLINYVVNKPEQIISIKYFFGTTSLLQEKYRIELLASNVDFFKDYIENIFFAKPLSFALNRGRENSNNEPSVKKLFSIWYRSNPNFIQNFNVSFRIISTYIKYFGIDDFVMSNIRVYLNNHILKKESSYVLRAWLDNQGDLKRIQSYVQSYLDENIENINAKYVLLGWLKNQGDIEAVRKYILKYLEKNSEDSEARFVLEGWLKNQNDIENVSSFLRKYLEKNSEDSQARFVLEGWLNNQGDLVVVREYILRYLYKNCEDPNASFVLQAWLDNGGDLENVYEFIQKYFEKNSEDSNASFVLKAYFKNQGDLKGVRRFVQKYLEKNSEDINASFVLKSWLNNQGDLESVREFVLKNLSKNSEDSDARFVLEGWLNNDGDLQSIRRFVQRYLEKHCTDSNASFVLNAWFKNKGDFKSVRMFVERYLEKHCEDVNSSYIFRFWFDNQGDLSTVRKYVQKYLDNNCEEPNSSFVFQSWFNNQGDLSYIRRNVQKYLKKNIGDVNAKFVLTGWLENHGELECIKEYLYEFLSEKSQDVNASFVLKALLDKLHDFEGVQHYVQEYLDKNCENTNARFVIQSWLDRQGDLGIIQEHVLQHLDKNCENTNAKFVIRAWLNNDGDLRSIREYMIRYLEKNCENADSSFVIQAWFNRKGDLYEIRNFLLCHFKKNATLKNSRFVLKNWIDAGGAISDIKIYIYQYLEANASYGGSNFILCKVLQEKDISISSMEKYLEAFLRNNIHLKSSSYILCNWLNCSGNFSKIGYFLTEFLEVYTRSYDAQHVISAWLRNGGEKDMIVPYLELYLSENHSKTNSGYLYVAWLNSGGAPEFIQNYLHKWISKTQPEKIAQTVIDSAYRCGMIKE